MKEKLFYIGFVLAMIGGCGLDSDRMLFPLLLAGTGTILILIGGIRHDTI